MKIKNIKINSYGNLKNKEINFKKINIIFGKNESGKSTLLNFIKNIFYGISKNKNGRNFSDYEKYLPWTGEEFSGKIKYELNNGNTYEIFRDFNKKNPKIYNEEMEDISEEYKIDKKTGIQFFEEQTNVDEKTFMSTCFAMQKEIYIDSAEQGILLQKVANLADSGAEDVSYKKVMSTLNTMLLNEVGTSNSRERPINITRQNIEKYEYDLKTINDLKEKRFYLENEINNLKENIALKNKKEKLLEKIKLILDKNKIEKEKNKIKKDLFEENKNKIKKLDNEKDNLLNKINSIENNLEKNKNNKKIKKNKIINFIIFLILIIINIFNFIFIKNKIINIILISLIPIYFIYLIINILKNKKINKIEKEKINKLNIENNEINNQMKTLDMQIEILEKDNEEIEQEIKNIDNKLLEYLLLSKEEIKKEYNNIYSENEINNLFDSDIDLIIEKNNKEINEYNLTLHRLEIDKENIEPELEKLLNIEEALEIEKEKLEELENRAQEFEITKELLEESYSEMKKNVSPKFNKSLSDNIEKISNGKYKNTIINDNLMVELDDGRYISADKLSIGTKEQIYLSLRLSIMNELSDEKLPIILDEAFAYYDDERLKAALDFFDNVENQVILFTCTNREKELLDNLNKEYNYIEL